LSDLALTGAATKGCRAKWFRVYQKISIGGPFFVPLSHPKKTCLRSRSLVTAA
jgi:hypothetical protein